MRGKTREERSTDESAVLHLTLHREFFDAIADGNKKPEYRADTPFWRARLVGRNYSVDGGFETDTRGSRRFCVFNVSASAKTSPIGVAIRLGKYIV